MWTGSVRGDGFYADFRVKPRSGDGTFRACGRRMGFFESGPATGGCARSELTQFLPETRCVATPQRCGGLRSFQTIFKRAETFVPTARARDVCENVPTGRIRIHRVWTSFPRRTMRKATVPANEFARDGNHPRTSFRSSIGLARAETSFRHMTIGKTFA